MVVNTTAELPLHFSLCGLSCAKWLWDDYLFEGYNADIICLQEVDKKVFDRDLFPRLEDVGLTGHLRMKFGEVHEGSAIFYRRDRFR